MQQSRLMLLIGTVALLGWLLLPLAFWLGITFAGPRYIIHVGQVSLREDEELAVPQDLCEATRLAKETHQALLASPGEASWHQAWVGHYDAVSRRMDCQ